MRDRLTLLIALCLLCVLLAGCGAQSQPMARQSDASASSADDVGQTSSGETDASSGGEVQAVDVSADFPALAREAAKRADNAYSFLTHLRHQAASHNKQSAAHHYRLNCHDPEGSAAAEFLRAWSDAVLLATDGQVYIEVGVSNAFCPGGTMTTLDDMQTGAIDFNWTLPCYFKSYMPLSMVIQNPALGINNATSGSYAMWELYKANADIQSEIEANGELLFIWANNPSPLSYKGTEEINDIGDIKGNIRGNNGPAQLFIAQAGGNVFGCPIGDVYTNVSIGAIDYLITDWHGIASFKLYEEGVLNH